MSIICYYRSLLCSSYAPFICPFATRDICLLRQEIIYCAVCVVPQVQTNWTTSHYWRKKSNMFIWLVGMGSLSFFGLTVGMSWSVCRCELESVRMIIMIYQHDEYIYSYNTMAHAGFLYFFGCVDFRSFIL